MGLIPTRRQVEWNGGYSNNWTTKSFCEYAHNVKLGRDHAGPMQGQKEDDGYESLKHDCKFFDLIHIDPWKKYPKYEEGLTWTVNMIKFCFNLNPHIEYEIGTEEGIRPFELKETEKFVNDINSRLNSDIFNKIKYIVVQSGALVKENQNLGNHDPNKLEKTIKIAKKHGLLTKEHNGDYLGSNLIKEKMNIGLDSINIGPEISATETQTYLDELNDEKCEEFNTFFNLSYQSRKWEKWVTKDFNPNVDRKKLISICGHYVFSNPIFIEKIKNKIPFIEEKIKNKVTKHLKNLCNGR